MYCVVFSKLKWTILNLQTPSLPLGTLITQDQTEKQEFMLRASLSNANNVNFLRFCYGNHILRSSELRAQQRASNDIFPLNFNAICLFLQDVGQKVEPTQCTQCGMVYNHAIPDDEQNHNKYHKRFLKASSFSVSFRASYKCALSLQSRIS